MPKFLNVSNENNLAEFDYYFTNIDQTYHPTGKYGQDIFEIVYSKDLINTTKFYPILLKEWFYLASESGFLIIDYIPNELCDFSILEQTMWRLWFKKYEIVYHGSLNEESEYIRFICKKKQSTYLKDDSIDKWTFGVITNGQKMEWIIELVAAIKSQNIPSYEIIICGTYDESKHIGIEKGEIKYIPFSDRDDKGWITRKKNLIVENAKYENLCILHDRVILDKDWYHGMKKWGNVFDHLTCRQTYDGQRAGDWIYIDKLVGNFYPEYKIRFGYTTLLDYRDYHHDSIIGGQMHISKRTYLKNCPWNETFFWAEWKPEDVDLSFRLRDLGHLPRFNPYASTIVKSFRFGSLLERNYDDKKLGSYKNKINFRFFGRVLLNIFGYLHIDQLMLKVFFNKKFYIRLFDFKKK